MTLAVRAEDVLVGAEPLRGLSARNVYAARITALERAGPEVNLRCTLAEASSGSDWIVRVTPSAVAALGLRQGAPVWLAVKSHSVRVL